MNNLIQNMEKSIVKNRELYILPAGVEVWSIDLQESIKLCKDIFVTITNTTTSADYVFVKKMLHFSNGALSALAGYDCSSYVPTKNDFGITKKKLMYVKNIDVYE